MLPSPRRPYPGLNKPRARFSDPEHRRPETSAGDQSVRIKKSRSAPTPRGKTFVEVHKHKEGYAKAKQLTLTEQFSEQLDDYREQLYQDAEISLEESKTKHGEKIEALASQFEQRLSLLSRCEQQLSSPVVNDSVNTTSFDDHDASGISDGQCVPLSQRMSEFGALLKAKEEALQRLFDEWNEVQAAIVALAVQTLGQNAVLIEEDLLHPTLTGAVSEAAAKHATAQAETITHQEKVDGMETWAKDLATKTVDAVDKAFEAYKLKMEKMQKQAEDLKAKREQLESEWYGP